MNTKMKSLTKYAYIVRRAARGKEKLHRTTKSNEAGRGHKLQLYLPKKNPGFHPKKALFQRGWGAGAEAWAVRKVADFARWLILH